MKSTYYIILGRFGHKCVSRRVDKNSSQRIYGEKPWGGGQPISTFRSRSDTAAIKQFKENVK